jgi:hypothetical protein
MRKLVTTLTLVFLSLFTGVGLGLMTLPPASAFADKDPTPPPPPAPSLTLPAEVKCKAGKYVVVTATTTAKNVQWVSLDDNLQIIDDVVLKKPNSVLITSDTEGKYRLEAFAAQGDVVLRAVTNVVVGTPPPPAPPTPPVPPVPPTPPTPTKADGALILFDSATLGILPQPQHDILYAQSVRTFLDGHTTLDADGKTHLWRIWDAGVDVSAETDFWKALVKTPHTSLPWIVLATKDGKVAYSGVLPANTQDTLTLLAKYTGG